MSNNNGVDLSTGKINLPLTLATLTGPNGFNETVDMAYSTLGLLDQIKNWNQDAPTGLCGLGWTMNIPYIARLGNGSINDQFFLNSSPLLLKSKAGDAENGYQLEFETAIHSMTRISYTSSNETWTVVDTDGVTYVYGGNESSIEWGIRWVSTDGQSPKVWIDSSIETDNQQQYALIWNLSYKQSIYGQRINYQYHKVSPTVGANSIGNQYDMASYLVGVQVENGTSLKLNYVEKEDWEYPSLRIQYNADGTTTNPYQDRIATRYLSSLCIYDSTGVVQQNIALVYGFLYKNLGSAITGSPDYPQINKRILTEIQSLSPDGIAYAPAQVFDYWGYHDDGFATIFNTMLSTSSDGLLKLTDSQLASAPSFTDPSNSEQSYQPLFGHLKNIQSPSGAIAWYSYSEVSANYNSVWNDGSWDQNWTNLLQSAQINPPDNKNVGSAWENAKPYWGPDGYVVIRWENEVSHLFKSNERQICLQIYEWISGQWVAVQFGTITNLCFKVTNFDDEHVIINAGMGKFGLIRTEYASTSDGSVVFFNRNPSLPGQWLRTDYLTNQTLQSAKKLKPCYSVQMDFGENIAAVLDKIGGNLYLYSLNPSGSWNSYSANPISVPSKSDTPSGKRLSTLCVTAKEVFVVNADTLARQSFSYWLYYYDPIQGFTSNGVIGKKALEYDLFLDGLEKYKVRIIKNLTLSQGSGFLVLSAELQGGSGTGRQDTYANRSIAISWDDERTQVNLQKIKNYQETGSSWGVSGQAKWLMFNPSTIPNEIVSTSNLINQTWEKNNNYPYNKQVLRFTGSKNADAAGNIGWNLDYQMPNLADNSDSWVIMATIDTTVATSGSSNTAISSSNGEATYTYSYQFYQYDPIQGWMPQNVAMGQNTDWVAIFETLDKALEYISLSFMLAGPIMMPFGIIAGELGALAIFISSAFDAADFILNGPQNIAIGIIESAALRNLLSGRRNGITESNNYLIAGTKKTNILSAYYKAWNGSSYKWTSLNQIQATAPLLAKGTTNTQKISEDTYFYCGTFGIFGFGSAGIIATPKHTIETFLHSDQVIIFRNGLVQNVLRMPLAELTSAIQSSYKNITSATAIPYLNTNSSAHPYLMAAPWGAILGYLPDTANIRQLDINKAFFLALFKVQNENITGQVTDYVVNQVTLNDGFQSYNTFYQYMPKDAYLQKGDSSVLYNCVKAAAGGSSYSNSAQQYGWTESYFYTPKPLYNPTTNSLAYDPANPQNAPYLANNQDQTNVADYFKMMIGKPYCQRVLKSQSATDNTTGFEISRQYTFYQAYQTNLIDYTTGASIGAQQTTGVVPTLTINLLAPDNSLQADINVAYLASQAVLSMQYAFYDIDGLRSPWSPNDATKLMDFAYTVKGTSVSLNTALPYASLSLSYDVNTDKDISAMTPCIKGHYQQSLSSGYIATLDPTSYDKAPASYQNFLTFNLFTPLQNNTWINENLSFSNDNNGNPIINVVSFWQAGWETISAQASTWQSITVQNDTSTHNWFPGAIFLWQGNADGTPQTDFLNFDWAGANQGSVISNWVSSGMSTLAKNGIPLEASSITATPSAIIYNNNLTAPIASFTNSKLANTAAFYLGFESYEDLSALTFYQNATQTDITSVLTNSYSNTGNRSVLYTTQSSETRYGWAKTFDLSTLSSGLWMATINYLLVGNDTKSSTPKFEIRAGNTNDLNPSNASTLNSTPLSSATTWSNGQIIFDLSAALKKANLSSGTLSIIFYVDIAPNYQNTLYIDNICFAPVESASFAISTYDSASKQAIASAIPADYSFANRVIYNNRGQAIASLRKQGTQSQTSAISLTGGYLSPNNIAPNTQFMISTSGTVINSGQNYTAGSYFDFRDGQSNGWKGGSLQNRLLLLNNNASATYPLTENVTSIGIRTQLQGWVQTYQCHLDSGSSAVGLPSTSDNTILWGAFTQSSSNSDLYAFDIRPNGKIFQQSQVSIAGTNPIVNNEGKLFVTNQIQHRLFGTFKGLNSDNNYYLCNFKNGGNKQIYCSNTEPLFAPVLSVGSNLYFADTHNALYCVDVSNVDNQSSSQFNINTLIAYTTILANSSCSAQPVANKLGTSIAFSLTDGKNTVIAKYDIFNQSFIKIPVTNSFNSSPAIADNGAVFIIDTKNNLCAYDVNLKPVNTTPLNHSGPNMTTGNGVVAVSFAKGELYLYDFQLNPIAQIQVANSLIGLPVMHGNKVSVVGTKNNTFTAYTYNTAGILACAPYTSTATTNLSIQAFSPELSDLIVIEDNATFTQLKYGVPSASLAIGNYIVSWDAIQKQYSLTGTSATVTPVTVKEPAYGDWLLTIVNNTLYFYADGQQIFAEAISSLPAQGSNYTINAGNNALAVRDIILINNLTMGVSYYDGVGKLRQTQSLAEIVPPQTSASTATTASTQVCVLVSEQLYDSLGRNAISTVIAAKGTGAINQTAFAFESGFIQDRTGSNPAFGGAALTGQVQSWVDTTNFNQANDTQYAYTGQYFESDPSSRLMQSSAPGADFNKDSDYSTTFSNGWVPCGLLTTFGTSLGLKANQLNTQYGLNAQTHFLGTSGTHTQANITTLSGRQISSMVADPNKATNFIMQTSVESVGAGMQNNTPYMFSGITALPNVYDATITDANKYILTQQSDAFGNTIYSQSPDAGVTQYYYDNAGRLRFSQNADQATKNGSGIVLYYCYDALNRLIEIGFFASTWDTAAFAKSCTTLSTTPLPSGAYTLRSFLYEQNNSSTTASELGRLNSVININSQEASNTVSVNNKKNTVQHSYIYNPQGQINEVITVITPSNEQGSSYTTQYAYNCLSQVTTMIYSDKFPVNYSYNIQGKVAQIGTVQDSRYYANYQYDVNGRVVNEYLADGALLTQRQYGNSLGQLTQLSTSITSSSTQLFTEILSYTNNGTYQDGNIQSINYSYGTPVAASTANYSYQYQYDIFGRLLSASAFNTTSSTPVALPAWTIGDGTMDANSNLQSMTQAGTKISYNYLAGTNQIQTRSDMASASYSYTANGLTQATPSGQTFIYDQLTQLPVQVQNTAFIYDAMGERAFKQVGKSSCTYIRGTSAWPLMEIDQGQHSLNYIYGPLGLICINNPQQSQDYFILKDHLNSSRVVYASSTGKVDAYYTYLPYGQLIEQGGKDAANLRYLYTAQEWDADISLYNYHARQYDPTLGRFLTPDPAHQYPSPYIYTGNNPVNYLDKTGKESILYVVDNKSSRDAVINRSIATLAKSTFPGGAIVEKPLKTLGTNDTLFVLAHGSPTTVGDFSPRGLARQMIEEGLPEKFQGEIKFLSCETGLGESEKSFAFKFQQFLASNDIFVKVTAMKGTVNISEDGIRVTPPENARARELLQIEISELTETLRATTEEITELEKLYRSHLNNFTGSNDVSIVTNHYKTRIQLAEAHEKNLNFVSAQRDLLSLEHTSPAVSLKLSRPAVLRENASVLGSFKNLFKL